MEIQAEISFQNNGKYLNQTLDVLLEGFLKEDPSVLMGRSRFQAPEVDGVVFSDSLNKSAEMINTIRKVEIKNRDEYDLYGDLLI